MDANKRRQTKELFLAWTKRDVADLRLYLCQLRKDVTTESFREREFINESFAGAGERSFFFGKLPSVGWMRRSSEGDNLSDLLEKEKTSLRMFSSCIRRVTFSSIQRKPDFRNI